MSNSLTIAFDCNNPDNGQFVGKFESVRFRDVLIEGPPTTIRDLGPTPFGRHARIGRCKYRIDSWTSWVGNWCWDELEIRFPLKLLSELRHRGFHCTEAPVWFYDAWNKSESIDPSRLQETTV